MILVAGYLAAGKSVFARRLSDALGIPCFCKDDLKMALSRSVPVHNREDSKRLSAATFDAMAFIAERFLEAGRPLVLEANFTMAPNHGGRREGETLRALAERYGCRALTYVLTGDPRALCDRFNAREFSPERGRANRVGAISYEDFAETVKPLGEFSVGGERILIDTTDFSSVDFDGHVEAARRWLMSGTYLM